MTLQHPKLRKNPTVVLAVRRIRVQECLGLVEADKPLERIRPELLGPLLDLRSEERHVGPSTPRVLTHVDQDLRIDADTGFFKGLTSSCGLERLIGVIGLPAGKSDVGHLESARDPQHQAEVVDDHDPGPDVASGLPVRIPAASHVLGPYHGDHAGSGRVDFVPESSYFDAGRGQMVVFDYVELHTGSAGREAYLLSDGRWLVGVRKGRGNLLQRRHVKRPPKWIPKRNSPLSRADYPAIFDDTDRDTIPDVDDPHPFTPGDTKSIEEVRLSDEVGHFIDDRLTFEPAMKSTMAQLREIGISGAKVEGRVKTPFSLVNKLRRKYMGKVKVAKGGELIGLTDVAGTRIVLPDQPSVDVATAAIESGFEILEKEDFYEAPQAGYRAVHYIVIVNGVPVELQVKTRRMSAIADASHAPYKMGTLNAAEMDRLTSLAARADAGDKRSAKELDALLRDKAALKRALTRKPNPRVHRLARRLSNPGGN